MATSTAGILARVREQDGVRLKDVPHTAAAYDEGRGLTSLYLTPLFPEAILAALTRLGLQEQMVDVTPRWGSICPARMPGFALATARPPVELVHGTARAVQQPCTLMADPHAAVPTPSTRLALSLHDRWHGVVYTHHEDVLSAFAREWLDGALRVQAPVASRSPERAPDPGGLDLASLVRHVAPGAWWEPVLVQDRGCWTAELVLLRSVSPAKASVQRRVRWVSGGAGWRLVVERQGG